MNFFRMQYTVCSKQSLSLADYIAKCNFLINLNLNFIVTKSLAVSDDAILKEINVNYSLIKDTNWNSSQLQ